MKRSRLNYAIFVMAVATIVSAAVVSCKKQTQEAPLGVPQTLQGFNPLDIQDMNAYLTDFKQKMQSAQKCDDDALSLEDAAWHISSLANFEFANVNAASNDLRFDTLYAYVNVTKGTVLLNDLATAYQTINSSIEKFYNSLTLDNKNFRFIDAYITENGEVTIPLLITFCNGSKYLTDHCWYFTDEWAAADVCDSVFPPSLIYPPGTTGLTYLRNELNNVVCHPYVTGFQIPSSIAYYTLASVRVFDYAHYTDPYNSLFDNSRLFYHSGSLYDDLGLEMCYLFDSYLGLGFDYLPTDQEIVEWVLEYTGQNTYPYREYHTLTVKYGILHEIEGIPGDAND